MDRTGHARKALWSLELSVMAVQPSTAGGGLVDLVLDDGPDDPPTLAAKPIWDMWHIGRPPTAGLRTGLDTAGREEWISAALIHHRRRPDDEPGRVYHLSGAHVTDPAGFYCAIGEAINGPGTIPTRAAQAHHPTPPRATPPHP